MEKKFTQGEWTTDGKTVYAGLKTEGRPFGINPIATVNQGGLGDPDGDPQANAKLISAAPELLEALQEVEYDVKDWAEYNEMQADSFEDNEKQMQLDIAAQIKGRLAKLKAAIKKATT